MSEHKDRKSSGIKNLADKVWFGIFVLGSLASTVGLLLLPDSYEHIEPVLNASLSVSTGGLVAFLFYWIVNVRADRRRVSVVRQGNLSAYRSAKHNILVAVIHASQRGGREDLSADTDTIEMGMAVTGFRELIGSGSQGNEGFYAFQNQMSHETFEFSEIIMNLKIIESAAERLLLSGIDLEGDVYKRLVSLSHIIRRIEANGAGYDESKQLCQFIWEMFAGWNWAEGQLTYDPIEKAFAET